jgi:nitronate monooxygenase
VRSHTDGPVGVNLVLEWDPCERLEIALDEGARLVSLSWGDPTTWIKRIHDAGALVACTVVSALEAREAVALGVDLLVAQGWEAGGHVRSQVATMALVPAVVDAAAHTPVVAAGGIADGRGLAAALALGADGAWIGTRFVASAESAAHDIVKRAIIAASESGTHIGEVFDGGWPGAPVRALRNSTVSAWEAAGTPPAGVRPGEGEIVGYNALGEPVERYSSDGPLRGASGDVEAMVLYAGQIAGTIQRIQPAAEIVREIADGALAQLRGFVETQPVARNSAR